MIDCEEQVYIPGAVCPECMKSLPGVSMTTGAERRRYFCFCTRCNRGFEVEQVYRYERWMIARYQPYSIVNDEPVADGDWICLGEPPAECIAARPEATCV